MKCIVNRNTNVLSKKIARSRIIDIISSLGYNLEVGETIDRLFEYMVDKKLYGGCHAISAILYTALMELGLEPQLLIGECQKEGNRPFDHSWLLLDDRVVDLAIYMPLTEKINSCGGPTICDIDIVTNKKSIIKYGINTGIPFQSDTQFAIETPLTKYMDNCPFEIGGLWNVVGKILPISKPIDREVIREKYKNTKRVLVR